MPLKQAVVQAVDDLVLQTSKLPAFLTNIESKVKGKVGAEKIVIDPVLEGTTGQQTEFTRLAEQYIVQRVKERFPQFEISQISATELGSAQYVLTATMTKTGNGPEGSPYRLNLALTDLKSELVIAQASVRASDNGLDANPTAFYRDSPALVKDRVVEGYIRTAETKPGNQADSLYLERLPTSALIAEAMTAYNAERITDALALYETAARRTDGKQLRVFNGIYICLSRLQRLPEAEQAFGSIVKLGLATNNLNIKLLFKPGTTDFIADPVVSAPYKMWLRQIAQQTISGQYCVTVIGHTSRTGSEQTNERLSLQRAGSVRRQLETEAPGLNGRLKEAGMGYRENIIGIGTDDARDALDRRVEFRLLTCN